MGVCYHSITISLCLMIIILSLNWYLPPLKATKPNPVDLPKERLLVSHRGGVYYYPENTIEAMKDSYEQFNVDMIETDIQMTADNNFIILHDDFLDRTTNGRGNASYYTLNKIQQLDAGYRYSPDGKTFPFRGKGLKVPSLQNVYDSFVNSGLKFSIEIKNEDPKVVDILVQRLRTMPKAKEFICFSSGWHNVIKRFRLLTNNTFCTVASEHEVIQLMVSVNLGIPRLYYHFFPLKAHIIQAPFTSVGGVNFNDKKFQVIAKELGVKLVLFTINNGYDIANCLSNGCQGVMTDRPDIAVRVMELMGLRKSFKESYQKFDKEVETTSWDCTAFSCLVIDTLIGVLPAQVTFFIIIFFFVFLILSFLNIIKWICCRTTKRKVD
ncbi:glycerophosphoryl diester phosphodiesterase [Entamoeba histolytica HM-3:IMSS]|uniref:Glycerophosphoryl diester phosphodiesterase, putative n=3 Tax=Entamoeba histolytica TaxID=5759 RepID=S0AVL4_ENTHI|nr:glycerophosphoryl diester phosphodiesterase, putative [Entamoeba histolytica KU27]EMS16716.1 glycerophosphoryl diester phosphodiesterase [Entamoeba histolytica HM-3:IMSS]BAN39160.1 glycerophosphoryl diester phosphodiesterase, putative [Entamoeba histolytica]